MKFGRLNELMNVLYCPREKDQVGGKNRSILPGDGDYEKPMRFSGIHVHLANGFKA